MCAASFFFFSSSSSFNPSFLNALIFVIPLSLGLPPFILFFAPLCPFFWALSLDLDWWARTHKTHLEDLSAEAVCVCNEEREECHVNECVFNRHDPSPPLVIIFIFFGLSPRPQPL